MAGTSSAPTSTRSLASAASILRANPPLDAHVELRQQAQRGRIFAGLLRGDERFELSLCNPPFHASAEDARRGSERKWRGLGKSASPRSVALNFGGQAHELWCTGGEASFVRRMANESQDIAQRVLWFSSLISNSATLDELRKQLARLGARQVHVVPMAQGNKQSRFVAWSFLDTDVRAAWMSGRSAQVEVSSVVPRQPTR